MFIKEIHSQVLVIEKRFHYPEHQHPHSYEIIFVLKGEFCVQIEEQTYQLNKDDFIMIPRGSDHLSWSNCGKCQIYNAWFEGELPMLNAWETKVVSLKGSNVKTFWFSKDKQKEYKLMNILNLLVLVDQEISKKGNPKNSLKKEVERPLVSVLEQRLRGLILERPSYKHSLDEISRQMGLNKYYLCSKFKKYNGVTVMQLYYRIKIELAREFYLSKKSIKETSYALGFSSQFHFSRKFKEVMGYAPSAEFKVR